MNEREHAVLSLFYDERNKDLTPSFLAYRMRMSTRDATALLDGMVKHGTLELHVDDEGHINYRLPPSERDRLQRHGEPKPQAGSAGQGGPRHSAHGTHRRRNQGQPQGADATPGYSTQGAQRSPQTGAQPLGAQRSTHDGTDGSVRSSVVNARRFTTDHASPPGTTRTTDSHPDAPYQEWYAAGETRHNPHHGPQHGAPYQRANAYQASPNHRPPHVAEQSIPPSAFGANYGKMPDHHALTPYQSDRHPAHLEQYQRRRERIPILAGALSLLVPGLGQFYNGEIGKGVMLLFSCLFLWVFLLFWIVWIWSVIDAYMVAEQTNQRALTDDVSPRHLLGDQRPHSNPNSNAA